MFAVPGFRFANPSLPSAIPTALIPATLLRTQDRHRVARFRGRLKFLTRTSDRRPMKTFVPKTTVWLALLLVCCCSAGGQSGPQANVNSGNFKHTADRQ